MPGYEKFSAALHAALLQAAVLAVDGRITLPEGIAIALAFTGAFAVRRVRNRP